MNKKSEVNPNKFSSNYKCGSCNEDFPNENLLKAHLIKRVCISTSKNQRNFKCDVCNKNFNTKGELKNHNARIHEPTNEPKKCKSGIQISSPM